eukprot:GABW01003983.1.p2 GENE.GABW01003983.1~~GABW01003983.1.p2  ORF type:complete len:57 (+),score=5.40 GABW01003983.1:26-196(+)
MTGSNPSEDPFVPTLPNNLLATISYTNYTFVPLIIKGLSLFYQVRSNKPYRLVGDQ